MPPSVQDYYAAQLWLLLHVGLPFLALACFLGALLAWIYQTYYD